jgi:hypothetical protein
MFSNKRTVSAVPARGREQAVNKTNRKYRPTLRIRVRRTLGFVLGVLFLALVDFRYHILPRLARVFRRKTR